MPVVLKNKQQIAKLRAAGQLVAETLEFIQERIKPGIKTGELDLMAELYIREQGAVPTYKGYRGSRSTMPPFPGTICTSVNEEICHGIPSARHLVAGDIVGIDIGAKLDGWCGDICATYSVGTPDGTSRRLLEVAYEALERGIAQCRPDKHLGDIGAAIQEYVEGEGFSVVREWTGHGIGQKPHEDAPVVLHHGRPGTGLRLRPGMVFTIEPMVNIGRPET
jgi:methionyl aminopeptidase